MDQSGLGFGATVLPQGGTQFRVWAPRRKRVDLLLEGRKPEPLAEERPGWFSATVADARPGDRYRFQLDSGQPWVPDPASRFQPEGPHGPSEIVDPHRFSWTDQAWRGLERRRQIIYELHLGTFTAQGTWAAAAQKLPALAELGVTCVEIMPIADFAGRFGWGYDGVNLFAPCRLYGRPDDARRFVDRAHGFGLGVILDVVYNHLGPDGNYLGELSESWFSKKHAGEWGDPINFDGADAESVRNFFIANAGYWIAEYHFDGLRLDATHAIFDDSDDHVLAAMARHARAAAGGRAIYLTAENESQQTRLVRPLAQGGYDLDAMWNDDFHHAARVAATGQRGAYYSDYLGLPQELLSALKWGYLYQGQRYSWQKKRRGTATTGVALDRFVIYLDNHDQVANTGTGRRFHQRTSPGRYRALTALTLLAPSSPLLFQGQEFAASAPFLYFADHGGELGAAVAAGRAQYLAQFPELATPELQSRLASPADPATFAACKLDWSEHERNAGIVELHRDLIRLGPFAAFGDFDGAVLTAQAFLLRRLTAPNWLLLLNLGAEERLLHAPEPLLAPPEGQRWRMLWSSEDPRYGGEGTPLLDDDERGWLLPAECCVLLEAVPC